MLAHELLCPHGGPSCEYYLVLAQTHLLKKDFAKAEEYLQQAAHMDYLVITFARASFKFGLEKGQVGLLKGGDAISQVDFWLSKLGVISCW